LRSEAVVGRLQPVPYLSGSPGFEFQTYYVQASTLVTRISSQVYWVGFHLTFLRVFQYQKTY